MQRQDYNMATLLAKKADGTTPLAKTDDHHDAMAADPTISAFPAGSTFGTVAPSTGFGDFGNVAPGAPSAPITSGGFGSLGNVVPGAPSTPATPGSFGSFGNVVPGAQNPTSSSFSNQGANIPNANNVQVVQNQGESLKSGGGAMSEGGESTVKLDKDATDWINKKMRPMMGWIYMLTCTCDFVVFPVLWSVLQAMSHGSVTSQWQPLTLQGAGLYHIAMGAVLGIAAYGRTKEKVAGVTT